MLKKNRIAALAITGVLGALLVGSLVVGSNMGFKFNQPLITGAVPQWISVPMISPYAKADDIVQTVLGGSGNTVTRLIPGVVPSFDAWNGFSGLNFDVIPGEGYEVAVLAPPFGRSSTIIVGAHDPSQTIPCDDAACSGVGFTPLFEYQLSIPYHTTASKANDLLGDLPPSASPVISRIVPGLPPGFDFWNGIAGVNFAVTLGESYRIKVAQPIPGGILWAHF